MPAALILSWFNWRLSIIKNQKMKLLFIPRTFWIFVWTLIMTSFFPAACCTTSSRNIAKKYSIIISNLPMKTAYMSSTCSSISRLLRRRPKKSPTPSNGTLASCSPIIMTGSLRRVRKWFSTAILQGSSPTCHDDHDCPKSKHVRLNLLHDLKSQERGVRRPSLPLSYNDYR